MKKISLIIVVLFTFFTTFAQRQMVDWPAGVDSTGSEQQIKDLLFYMGGEDFITVDHRPTVLTVKNHKATTHDNRTFVPNGVVGRVVDIKKIAVDSIQDPNAEAGTDSKLVFYKKVYYVRFEKDGKELAILPFTVGAHPDRGTPFGVDVTAQKTFVYNGHFYELANGSATLQLPLKALNDFKIASGYGF